MVEVMVMELEGRDQVHPMTTADDCTQLQVSDFYPTFGSVVTVVRILQNVQAERSPRVLIG